MRTLGLLAALLVLLSAGPSHAHPGRLDSTGCHTVHKDFTYTSGQVVNRGDDHCHRLAVGRQAVLDGLEVLSDDAHKAGDEEERSPESR